MKSIFCVKDRATDVFLNIFTEQTANAAIRAFGDAVNSQGSDNGFNKHPDDFDLYLLGSFDEDSGVIVPESPPSVVVRAKDLVRG